MKNRLFILILAVATIAAASALVNAVGFKLQGGTLTLSTGCVTNDSVATTAAIDADKLQHVHVASSNFALAIAGTPVAREEVIYVSAGSETIRGFHALLNDTGTTTDCDFVLKKNGTEIMNTDLTITHSEADREVVDGDLSSTTLAAGDVLSFELVVTSSTAAQGPFAWVVIDAAAP